LTQVIYKIINLVNDKFYVGSTTNKKIRFRQHRKLLRGNRHHCKHLQSAWNKYGEEKFTFEVVEEVPINTSLEKTEDRWLKEHYGQPYCYNSGASADAPWRGVYGAKNPKFGQPRTDDEKAQISAALKEFYAADYFNHPRVGKTHSAETKAKISAAKKLNTVAPWAGKERSAETKAKISAAQLGKPKAAGRKVSEDGKAKIRAAAEAGNYSHWQGRKHTEESKAKMSKEVISTDPAGKEHIFASLTETLQTLGLLMPTLNRALKSGKPLSKGPRKDWAFRYSNTCIPQRHMV